MLSVEAALDAILATTRPGPTERIPLDDALGRVLAEPAVSDVDSPPFDKAVMDGFAVCSTDFSNGSATLAILEQVTAGMTPTKKVTPGSATRIMTGAPLPAGADAVVKVEEARIDEAAGRVSFANVSVAPGQHLIRRGVSLRAGDTVLAAGRRLQPQHIGALAEVGCSQIVAYAAPTLAVLATGDELVPIDRRPGPGQIRNSNEIMFLAQARRAGASVARLGIARDDRAELRERVLKGLQSDVLLLSGGVSEGVLDLVPSELAALGVRQVFHKVNLRPGKPLWFGLFDHSAGEVARGSARRTYVFGLPGNPVSGLVCFELFVRPCLRKLAGQASPENRSFPARLARDHVARGDRPTYNPARLTHDGQGAVATILPWHGSSDLRATVDANGLAIIPGGDANYPAGSVVEVIAWNDFEELNAVGDTPATQPQGREPSMATATQQRPIDERRLESATREPEPTVRSIIDAARSVPKPSQARGAWVMSALTAVLFWASFPPLDFGPLGWVALVPLLLLVRSVELPRRAYWAMFVCASIGEVLQWQWLHHGHPVMFLAAAALGIYFGLYFPVFVWLARTAVHRLRIPFTFAIPALWVGSEFLRGHLMTGCSWYSLGHTQYRWTSLIQISDLVGAYGVSFVVATASAAMACAAPARWMSRIGLVPPAAESLRRQRVAVGCAIGLLAACVAYGFVRRGQAEFVEGPRIALIQGNFTSTVKHDPAEAIAIFRRHFEMSDEAVKAQPDLIVWPETMYREPLMQHAPGMAEADFRRAAPFIPPEAWKVNDVPKTLHDISQRYGAGLIVGVDAYVADRDSLRHYNSAAFVKPSTGLAGRYDKLHRVIFGEYVPLRDYLPMLRTVVPYGPGFGIDAGQSIATFDYGKWRLLPSICYEDTVPHLVRGMVREAERSSPDRRVDCLVNLTNDGWFHGSSGLDQHLISSLFRCVECRKPMVRAVNTGISAIIDGDGVVVEPDLFVDIDAKQPATMRDPQTGRWRRQMNAVLVDSVPLDNRTSLYVRAGDWFAGSCGFIALAVALFALIPRRLLWTTVRAAG